MKATLPSAAESARLGHSNVRLPSGQPRTTSSAHADLFPHCCGRDARPPESARLGHSNVRLPSGWPRTTSSAHADLYAHCCVPDSRPPESARLGHSNVRLPGGQPRTTSSAHADLFPHCCGRDGRPPRRRVPVSGTATFDYLAAGITCDHLPGKHNRSYKSRNRALLHGQSFLNATSFPFVGLFSM